MNQIKINTWQEWENICTYLASEKVKSVLSEKTGFIHYGSPGQSQFGVDLVPNSYISKKVVVQCKHLNGMLTEKIVEGELKKTDKYSNDIDVYLIYTTGKRDARLIDKLEHGHKGIYQRADGKKFNYFIFYWDDMNPLVEWSDEALSCFFPNLFQQRLDAQREAYLNSLQSLRDYIPIVLTKKDLEWLEKWDFYKGWMYEEDINPFLKLKDDVYQLGNVLRAPNIFTCSNNVLKLRETLPAGHEFFGSLSDFCNEIMGQIISKGIGVEKPILTITDLPSYGGICKNWKYYANTLSQVYRSQILGEQVV